MKGYQIIELPTLTRLIQNRVSLTHQLNILNSVVFELRKKL
jgi:hypothetical protein